MSQKKLLIILSSAGLILVITIIAVAMMVFAGSGDSDSEQNKDRSGSFNSGKVSDLSGGTYSYRNLKGLTLRINQIETCNPEVVTAYISVSTDKGKVNTSFGKNDVSVYLDGDKIKNFEFKAVDTAKSPLSNMLLIDHSGSMDARSMSNAKSAAKQYVGKLKSGDQAGLIKFDDRVETVVPMTTDKSKVTSAVDNIQPRGDTSIFDAIASGIDSVPDCGRKAVTVLTDGEDTTSTKYTEQSVTEKANKENLPVFAVGIKSPDFDPSAIRSIAEKSGGQYLEANTSAEIDSIYDKINSQLTGQFVANFKIKLNKNGSEHTLKIVSEVEGSATGSERVFVF